jgi:hypothetical protein
MFFLDARRVAGNSPARHRFDCLDSLAYRQPFL